MRAANVKVSIFIDDCFPKPEPSIRSRNEGKINSSFEIYRLAMLYCLAFICAVINHFIM